MQSETTLFISPDHPALAGHFPGNPIVPGVFLLDSAIRAARQLIYSENFANKPVQDLEGVCQVKSAKFLSPVGPGETLTITCNCTVPGSARFEISSGSRKVAAGMLLFQTAP